jgi:hypothetical protein
VHGPASPGLNRPSQAKPKSQPGDGFGLAWEYEKPKLPAQAAAYSVPAQTL